MMANSNIWSGMKDSFYDFVCVCMCVIVCDCEREKLEFVILLNCCFLKEHFEQMVNSLCSKKTFMSFH